MQDCCQLHIPIPRTIPWLQGWITFILIFFSTSIVSSQCTITGPNPIPDNDFITLGFNVSGLTNANLASAAQGICGVDISFNHEYLSDLTITLFSPAGDSVQLIGPTTNTTMGTNLSTWNVHFIPCSSTADPDTGFQDTWSNNQGWQSLATYSGDYYPAVGCLEDFDAGSANGQWLIIVKDHDFLQVGNLLSITILFCDSTGLNCSECIPNAGVLSPASFDRCAGENIQSSDISVNFGNNIPSSLLYGYDYLLVEGTTILQYGVAFSASLPAGSYTLCGLSYLLDDSTDVNATLAAGDLSGLQQDILSGVICGDLTDNCIPIEIEAPPDTVVVSTNLCQGEIYSYGGQDYTTTGTFYQVHDGPGMCDTFHEIRIFARSLDVVINPTDTLTCGSGSVDIQTLATGAVGPFTYQWTTINGNIISAVTNQTIQVDQAGQYFVEVSDGICEGSGSVQVFADQGFPQVFFEGGTLNCDNPVIPIETIFIPSDASILWTGPFGFSSTQPNISITVPGTYQIRVTNTTGCTTTRSVVIDIDTATNPLEVIIIGKDCAAGTITLGDAFPNWLNGWNWTGPNMFTSDYWRPVVSDAGVYTLVGTFGNGCTRSATYFFDGDFALPDITIPPQDTLNCNEVISLTVSSTTQGAEFEWSGPMGFSSQQPTIMISQEGTYNATVIAPNECVQNGAVTVVLGDDIFDYDIITDTLTCIQTQVTIGVFAPQADTYDWLNYTGPGDDGPFIDVTTGGNYQVLMRDTNSNCEVLVEVQVIVDRVIPSFNYTTDTITCNDPIAELNFVPFQGYDYASVHWELPDLTIVQGPTLMSGLPGEHRLVADGVNGCIGVWLIHIPFDTLSPFVILDTDTLICLDTVQILSQSLDSIVDYQWSGPGILSSFDGGINVDEPGWYHLSAYGINGCPAVHDILVDSNFIKPSFTLVEDSLRCDTPATLSAISSDLILQYHWFDPAGNLIGSDSTVDVSMAGIYTFDIQGANRCVDYDTLVVDPPSYPIISITTDTFTCTIRTASLYSHVDIQPIAIAWLDTNLDTISHADQVEVSQSGPFYLVVTGPNGCITIDTTVVPSDSTAPIAMVSLIGEVRCKDRDVIFDGSGSLPSSIVYDWSTIGGNILSNPAMPVIDARDTGFYQLIITIPKSGCMDTASYRLLASPDEISQAILEVTRPRCHAEMNAAIAVTGISGGIAPIMFQLNGGPLQSDSLFNQLTGGMYLLTIVDSTGCEYDTLIDIPVSNVFTANAGPDIEITIGETVTLHGITDLIATEIEDQAWDSLGTDLCHDCPDLDVSPLETSTYTFIVSSVTGCVLQDEVTVYVVEKGKFYIPNIFSPNGDNINDEVRIDPSPGIQKVLQWVIFDRWGDAVYGRTNFEPDDTSVFWDGRTTTGEFSNPGVFPYILEIQLVNGVVELLHGNITLIR